MYLVSVDPMDRSNQKNVYSLDFRQFTRTISLMYNEIKTCDMIDILVNRLLTFLFFLKMSPFYDRE